MRVNIGMPVVRTDGRSVGHVITKFSGMGRFIYPWCSAGALRARSSARNSINRKDLVKLCISNYKLMIETGRYEQTPLKDRFCPVCNSGIIEDEFHFLLHCPKYSIPGEKILQSNAT